MEEFDKFPYFFEEGMRLVAHCPLCEAKLNPIRAEVVDERDDLNVMHVQCSKCKGALLVILVQTNVGVNSVVMVSDLSYHDVCSFRRKGSLSADQVIDIHQCFRDKDVVKKILALK